MGREAQGMLSLAGESAEGRILLESDVLILRGALRRQFPRASLGAASADGDDLLIPTPDGPLRARLGGAEALRWVKALARPAPSLADKLGIGPDRRAFLLTAVTDPDLTLTLAGATAASAEAATVDLAEVTRRADLGPLLARLGPRPVWIVTVKGKGSPLPEDEVRSRLREAGLVDSKSCAVSAVMSATRYAPKRA